MSGMPSAEVSAVEPETPHALPRPVRRRRLTASMVMLFVQIAQSGGGLVSNAVLIVALGSANFGVFALAQAIVFYVIGLLDAAYLTPATIRASRLKRERAERHLFAQLPTVWGLLGFTLLVLGLVLPFLMPHLGVPVENRWTVTGAILVAASTLAVREIVRMVCLSSHQLKSLLATELIGNAIWLIAVVAAARYWLPHAPMASEKAILIYALPALTAAGWLLLRRLRIKPLPTRLRPRAVLRRGRLSLLASQVTWLQSQSYVYFVAAMLSAQALGWVSATRMLFAPLQTMSTGVMRGSLPDLARLAASGPSQALGVLIRRIASRMALATLAWTVFAVIAGVFFGDMLKRHGYDITPGLIVAWGAVFLFMLLRSVVTQALRAMECFAHISRQSAFGAAASVILIPVGIKLLGATGALIGLGSAEALAMTIGIRTLRAQIALRARP